MNASKARPILVSTATAKQIIDVGNTKFWQLVKSKKIEMVDVEGRRMVVFASLEKLAEQPNEDALPAAVELAR